MLPADQNPGGSMNRKFLQSTAVLFVLSMTLGVMVHAILLNDDYSRLPQLYRTEQVNFATIGVVSMGITVAWLNRRAANPASDSTSFS